MLPILHSIRLLCKCKGFIWCMHICVCICVCICLWRVCSHFVEAHASCCLPSAVCSYLQAVTACALACRVEIEQTQMVTCASHKPYQVQESSSEYGGFAVQHREWLDRWHLLISRYSATATLLLVNSKVHAAQALVSD